MFALYMYALATYCYAKTCHIVTCVFNFVFIFVWFVSFIHKPLIINLTL